MARRVPFPRLPPFSRLRLRLRQPPTRALLACVGGDHWCAPALRAQRAPAPWAGTPSVVRSTFDTRRLPAAPQPPAHASRPRSQRPGQPHHALLGRLHGQRAADRRGCQEPGHQQPDAHRLRRQAPYRPQVRPCAVRVARLPRARATPPARHATPPGSHAVQSSSDTSSPAASTTSTSRRI